MHLYSRKCRVWPLYSQQYPALTLSKAETNRLLGSGQVARPNVGRLTWNNKQKYIHNPRYLENFKKSKEEGKFSKATFF